MGEKLWLVEGSAGEGGRAGSLAGMGRKPCCEKVGLKRGPWTAEEDGKLVSYITTNGICCWRAIPKLAGLLRCGKSCRLRWTNYLRPDLKRGIFTEAEENLILDLHATLGNRWSRIAAQLPGRTDNEIKNYWNTRLKKRLRSQGLDPATHLPLESKESPTGVDDGDDDDDGDSCDDVSNSSAPKKKRSPKIEAPAPKVRQPKGPKPQLKMFQSKEGPQLVLLKSDVDTESTVSDQSNSGSTVTAEKDCPSGPQHEIVRKLTTAPSFPQAELWKCIKPSNTPSELLNEWDSYILQSSLNNEHIGESNDVFEAFAQSEIQGLESWTMDTELHPQLAPESLFAAAGTPTTNLNPSGGMFPELHQHLQAQELQRLATLLDLI